MLTELASRDKVVGVKQSARAIRDGRASRVFLACDADRLLTGSHPQRLRPPSLWRRATPWPSWAVPAASQWAPAVVAVLN